MTTSPWAQSCGSRPDLASHMIVFFSWWAIAILVFGAAFRWGARAERLGAFMMILAYLLTPIAGLWSHPGLETGVLIIDGVLGAGLLILAMQHARWWLLLACANQALVVMAHMTAMIDPNIWTRAAITSRTGFGLMVLFSLGLGIAESRVARATGFDPRPPTANRKSPGPGCPAPRSKPDSRQALRQLPSEADRRG